MEDNFTLFDKYPHYIFNFSGANRYRFMKEYFPADFANVKKYVDEGRWFPAGSSMEEGDVNAPSAEAIIRQILYGNNWFRSEFGFAIRRNCFHDCCASIDPTPDDTSAVWIFSVALAVGPAHAQLRQTTS
jgi:alpha-mannosidase